MKKYNLIGQNGNAFSLMGYVIHAMKSEGFSPEEVKAYKEQSTSGSYDNLLMLAVDQIEACNLRAEGVKSEK